MKKYFFYLLFVAVMLVTTGCNKKKQSDTTKSSNTSTTSRDPDDHPIFYSIDAFHDVTISKSVDTTVIMPIHIGFYPSSVGVVINAEKLPTGVVVTPKSLTVYDSFDTTFIFKMKIDSVGVFTVNIYGHSTSSGRYSSNSGASFNITVK